MNVDLEPSAHSPSEIMRACRRIMEQHEPEPSELARFGYDVARRAVQDGLRTGRIRPGTVEVQQDATGRHRAAPVTMASLGGVDGVRALVEWGKASGLIMGPS